MTLMELVLLIAWLVAVAVLAPHVGVDSRDGCDWTACG